MVSRNPKSRLGQRAEAAVVRYLERRGYAIVGRNVRAGRLEIDIIARDRNALVICEVRARSPPFWVHPASTVTREKQMHLRQAAMRFRARTSTGTTHTRFDVAAVTLGPRGDPVAIEYFRNAF